MVISDHRLPAVRDCCGLKYAVDHVSEVLTSFLTVDLRRSEGRGGVRCRASCQWSRQQRVDGVHVQSSLSPSRVLQMCDARV